MPSVHTIGTSSGVWGGCDVVIKPSQVSRIFSSRGKLSVEATATSCGQESNVILRIINKSINYDTQSLYIHIKLLLYLSSIAFILNGTVLVEFALNLKVSLRTSEPVLSQLFSSVLLKHSLSEVVRGVSWVRRILWWIQGVAATFLSLK